MAKEACLWLKAGVNTGPQRRADVWDPERKRWTKAVGFDGQPRMERLPQVGFHGNDIENMRKGKLSDRAVEVLTMHGDIVWKNLTPSAAAEATDHDRHRVRREANSKGWIYVGECPIRAVHSGLRRNTLISDACKPDAAMCNEGDVGMDSSGRPQQPCPHFLAEHAARVAKQRGGWEREQLANRTAEQAQLEAVKEQSAATNALAEAIRAQSMPAPAAPDPEPPKAPAKK